MSGIGSLPFKAGPTQPTQEELVAIATAVELLWPKPTVEQDVNKVAGEAWKFANRWWQGAHINRRGRPSRPSSFS